MSSEQVQEIFVAFASFGVSSVQREIDNSKFSKLCKDTGLIDRQLSKTDVDLIFTKAKPKAERKLAFQDFINALQMIADKKGINVDLVMDQIVKAGGPSINGTVAEPTRFHDDKGTYTGVYARGGPTNIDRGNVSLNGLLDRSDADVRGVKADSVSASGTQSRSDEATPPISGSSAPRGSVGNLSASHTNSPKRNSQASLNRQPSSQGALPAVTGSRSALGRNSSGNIDSSASASRRTSTQRGSVSGQAQPKSLQKAESRDAKSLHKADSRNMEESLAQTFQQYVQVSVGEDLDSARFAKLLKDNGLLDKKFTQTSADLLFTKAKPKGAKKLSWEVFRQVAIPLIAEAKGCSEADIVAQLAASSGPKLQGTVAEPNRFHDDKSSYTGVYAAGGPTNVDDKMSLSALADRDNKANVRGVISNPGATNYHSSTAAYMSTGAKDTPGSGHGDTGPKRNSTSSAASGAGNASSERSGSIYDRLNDKSTFTGVYAKRFDNSDGQKGRINDEPGTSGSNFDGNTNSNTGQPVHDLSDLVTRR